MKTVTTIVAAHVLGILALLAIGLWLNTSIAAHLSNYQGVITVFSTAFGVYSFAINYLYHRNQNVYLWVHRALLILRRTHTYWLPAFDYALGERTLEARRSLLSTVELALSALSEKKIKRTDETPYFAKMVLDDVFFLVLRCDESHLFVSLDRRILVPSHLYERYCRQFAKIAETVATAANAGSIRLGMTITFDDGVVNPYYGFFVRRIPSHVLRHFEASFQFGHSESCQIIAGTNSISIEGESVVDFFAGLSQVVALEATPMTEELVA